MAAEKAAGSALRKPFSRVVGGAIGDFASRVEAYRDRNEGSDQLRHRATVPVARLAWLALRYFAEPIENVQSELKVETGFDWLTDDDFAGEIDQEACWRRPFTFAEVAAGYAVDRERPARDEGGRSAHDEGERENVTESLLDQLRDGGQRVLLGRPGSGKTTICKSVARRWHEHEETGPVLYRKSGAGTLEERSSLFERAVERATARGPALVVVEDAARRETVGFLETVKEYAGDSHVSFLLDSRVSEWRAGGERFREEVDVGLHDAVGKDVRSLVGGEIEQRRVPSLDEREVERVVERFTEKTGKPVNESPEEILERIRSREAEEDGSVQSGAEGGAWPSPMLLLVYHLQRGDYAVDPEAMDEDGPKSALRTNVEEAYEAVADPVTSDHELMLRGRPELREQVAVLVNVLNAAGLGVRRELVHALADSHSDHDTIDGFLDNMEGILHFGVDEGTRYHAPHPLWSTLYLEVLLERKESEVQAREAFEEAVNALFSFVDDREQREEFREWYGRDVGLLSDIDENPTNRAEDIVSGVFGIGIERPKLVPLYGATEYSGLELPETCSVQTRVKCTARRGQMFRVHGDREQAVRELEKAHQMGSEADIDSDWLEANHFAALGNIALARGNFDSAQKYHNQSLEIRREADDNAGIAASLEVLGLVARNLGDYERAKEYHERSLQIRREESDRTNEAKSLHNLGSVSLEQGNTEAARRYYEQSLDLTRKKGSRHEEVKPLHNIGLVASEQGEYQQAQEYHEEGLEIFREIGDRAGEAMSLNNLGTVAVEQNHYEQARKYHRRSLEIFQEVGDRAGAAKSFNNLGQVASVQDDYEKAREYYQRAAHILRDIGAIPDCLTAYENLVRATIEMDTPENAIDYAETALSMIEES